MSAGTWTKPEQNVQESDPPPINEILAREGFGGFVGEYIDCWRKVAGDDRTYVLFKISDGNGSKAYAVVVQNSCESAPDLVGWFDLEENARRYIQGRVQQ